MGFFWVFYINGVIFFVFTNQHGTIPIINKLIHLGNVNFSFQALIKKIYLFKKITLGAGSVAEWLSLRSPLRAAQGLDPGRGHGTARQATLWRRPTSHN